MYANVQCRVHFFNMWNSISGFDNLYHFLFEVSCYVVLKVRYHQQFCSGCLWCLSLKVAHLLGVSSRSSRETKMTFLVPDLSHLKFSVQEFALPIQKNVCSDFEVSTFLRSDASLECLQSVLQGVYDDFFGSWLKSIVLFTKVLDLLRWISVQILKCLASSKYPWCLQSVLQDDVLDFYLELIVLHTELER